MPRKAKHVNEILYEAIKKFLENKNIDDLKNVTLIELLENVVNHIMLAEREAYLKKTREEEKMDYANGFYERELATSFGKLNIKVPRVRVGKTFRPSILPQKWKRVDEKYESLLLALLANGYSREQIRATLKKLNLPYDEETLDFLAQNIFDDLKSFKDRELKNTYLAVFIDAYHTKVRLENKQIKNMVIYTAVGIDLEGYREILGYWIKPGYEKKEYWIDILQDMITRGLRKVGIIVTDDFNGLRDLIPTLFPMSDHQLCIVHVLRNLRSQVNKKDFGSIKSYFVKIKESETEIEAEEHFGALIEFLEKKYPNLAKNLVEKKKNILAFVKYPKDVRRYIYTTNLAEGINSAIDRMRIELGGYFPSLRTLEINLAIQFSNLNEIWLKRPIYVIRGSSNEILQVLNIKFELPNKI